MPGIIFVNLVVLQILKQQLIKCFYVPFRIKNLYLEEKNLVKVVLTYCADLNIANKLQRANVSVGCTENGAEINKKIFNETELNNLVICTLRSSSAQEKNFCGL